MIRFLYLLAATALFSCGNRQANSASGSITPEVKPMPTQTTQTPAFEADSAYRFVENQVKFGPRVPNSPAHKACGDL